MRDDGQHVHQDIQRGGRGEILDGLDIGGDGAEQGTCLVSVVVAEREALQVLIGPHAQVVRNPLANALGVVVIDIAGQRSDQRDHHEGQCRQGGDMQLVTVLQHGPDNLVQPVRQLMIANNVVDDDFQRPGTGQAHAVSTSMASRMISSLVR